MTSVTATVDPVTRNVLVEAFFGDVGGAECVRVERRDATTADVLGYLRPYVWPCGASGEYQHLSGGWALFWDTEASLDRAVVYVGSAVDAAGATLSTTASSASVTVASNGDFMLRDPLRPCNDRVVSLCFDNRVPCVPGEAIFFIEMAQESYAANSALLNPTNARRPIAISRQRRDAMSQLTVATRTFPDRDAVLALNEPGSPLLFQAPPAYGIPDRYMAVDTVTVTRGLPDHTFTPRLISMPFTTVDRPIGPAQGVCGSRFDDICDTYPTWGDASATGLAWSTLILGTAAERGFRTWGDTLADFGTWTNVLANGTWQQNRDD